MGKEINKMFSILETLKSMTPSNFGLMLDIGTKLAGPDGEAWHVALKAQLKAGASEVVATTLPAKTLVSGTQQAAWQRVYDKYFAALKVTVPAFADIEGKVGIYVDKWLTCDIIYDAWTFKKWKWCGGSIDAQLVAAREERSSIGSYLVRVEDGVEPDSRFLGKSTRTVDLDGTLGITLKERMLLELMHYEQTGKHLDVRGATFCSGSRYSDGLVPSVCLGSDGHVSVGGYNAGDSDDRGGVREAVLEAFDLQTLTL